MGHSSSTNYTISSSVTTEQNGDSVIAGTLPNQVGNGSVILTITPNIGFTVNASDFTISGISADDDSVKVLSNIINLSTGNLLSVIQYNYINSSGGGNSVFLPSEIKNVVMFNSEYDYDALANLYVPVTANNVVYVHVYFMDTFIMPSQDVVLNIDIDGAANSTNAIQYPAVWETWSGPIDNSVFTLTKTLNPSLINGNLNTSTSSNTELNNVSGLVDDGVQTLLMTKTFTSLSGYYFTSITEYENFTVYGLSAWLPYFSTIIASESVNTDGELTSRTIEFWYTNPPLSSGLDPTFGGNSYGLGFLFEYVVQTQVTTSSNPNGGVTPLSSLPPLNLLAATTSSEALGGEVENINLQFLSKKDTTFFKNITSVVMDTDRRISAITGEKRFIIVYGDVDAAYYITISSGSNTYDSSDDTFTSTATQINGVIGSDGSTTHLVDFPVVTSDASYVVTIGSRFGTIIPTILGDGTSGNIGTISSPATVTFTIAFTYNFTNATCDYNNDPTIAHDDDDGKIQAGMTVSGTGIPAGATVATRTSDTAFELSASTTGGNVVNGTLTFSEVSETMPSNIVFNFAELNTENANQSWKVSVDGDVGEEFTIVSDSDGSAISAMSVTSGSADGWEWGMSGFKIVNNGVNTETNKANLSIGAILTIQTIGDGDVQYTMALDSLTNAS